MIRSISLCLVVLASFSSQTTAQDLYRAHDCGASDNPDAQASPQMEQTVQAAFPSRPVAAGMIINIGELSARMEMWKDREGQCEKRSSGSEFDPVCPMGERIEVDNYVAEALEKFGDQDNGSIQKAMEKQIKDARVEARAMMSICNDR